MRPTGDLSESTIGDLTSLSGRVSVVTGGARGIGRATCRRLGQAGSFVYVADLDSEAAGETADALTGEGLRSTARQLDVTDRSSVSALADAVATEHGRLDVWVNNAGIYPRSPFLDLTDDQWDEVLSTNLNGTFIGSQEAARAMIRTNSAGVIINIGSTSSFRGGPPGLAHYSASKHGIAGLTKSLALELGPRGIRVLAIAPTRVATEGLEKRLLVPEGEDERAAFEDAGIGGSHEIDESALPLGRSGVPDDVARVVLFCASDLASLMTGSILAVDAGVLAI